VWRRLPRGIFDYFACSRILGEGKEGEAGRVESPSGGNTVETPARPEKPKGRDAALGQTLERSGGEEVRLMVCRHAEKAGGGFKSGEGCWREKEHCFKQERVDQNRTTQLRY